MGRDVGRNDVGTRVDRLDDRQREPLVEGRDDDNARSVQGIVQFVLADAASGDRLAGAHRGVDAPVVDSRLLAGHPDDEDVAGVVAACGRDADGGQGAVRVLAALVSGHHHDRAGRVALAFRASFRDSGRPGDLGQLGRPPDHPRQLVLDEVRDADELVIAAKRIEAGRVLDPRSRMPQVDGRVVHRDEVEDDRDLVGGALQHGDERLGARSERRRLDEHRESGHARLGHPRDLLARAGEVIGQGLEAAVDEEDDLVVAKRPPDTEQGTAREPADAAGAEGRALQAAGIEEHPIAVGGRW